MKIDRKMERKKQNILMKKANSNTNQINLEEIHLKAFNKILNKVQNLRVQKMIQIHKYKVKMIINLNLLMKINILRIMF